MSGSATPTDLDLPQQLSCVLRSNEDTLNVVAEHREAMTEAAKLERDRSLAPWQLVAAGAAAAAAFFGAGAAFVKLLGP